MKQGIVKSIYLCIVKFRVKPCIILNLVLNKIFNLKRNNMKTTQKLIGVLLLVILAQFTFANNPNKKDQTDMVKFRKHLISQIAFPSKIKNADGQQVTVYFEINADLKPEICKVETNNPAIEKFIRAEFESMEIPAEYSQLNQTYSIKIKFNFNQNR